MSSAYIFFLLSILTRTAIVFFVLLIGFRIFGKRQIGQMNVYDLAMIMAIANAVQNAMTNGDGNVTAGMTCSGTLLVLGFVLSKIFVKMPKLQDRVVGTPTLLINRGVWIERNLRREKVTKEEVLAAMRQHGLESVDKVMLAMLEVDGTISIIPRTEPHVRTQKSLRQFGNPS